MTIRVPTCSKCARSSILHQAYSGRIYVGLISWRASGGALLGNSVLRFGFQTTTIQPTHTESSSLSQEERTPRFSSRGWWISSDHDRMWSCWLHVWMRASKDIEHHRLNLPAPSAPDYGVPFHTVTYPELGFREMDEVVRRLPMIGKEHSEASGLAPCSFCGVFRRRGLQYLARSTGAHLLAFGHNLDDMAQTVA